jgi:hypothetical protein
MAATTKAEAVKQVDSEEISPAECFVTFVSTAEGWAPLTGTGCAHYVAHILGIRRGQKGISACDLGFTIKVPALVQGMTSVEPSDVAVNDVWTNRAKDHCGIVTKVKKNTGAEFPTITITHCASNHAAGRLGPTVSDWRTFFGAHGHFYRPG